MNSISTEDPEKFTYLNTVVVGRMMSNALLGDDLADTEMNFRDTSVFLDTPIILQLLGLLGDAPRLLAEEIIGLLKKVKAKIGVFEHDVKEVDLILKNAERYLESSSGGRGNVLFNLREIGYSPSDVVMLRGILRDKIKDKEVEIVDTPQYIEKLQISEVALEEEMVRADLRYHSEGPKRIDINSIRSIYVLRNGKNPRRIEECGALFVTTNSALARAAYAYGFRHAESNEISSVITDFSLTNLLWLKSSVDIDIPKRMMAVNCYAALRPTDAFWAKFLAQIEKLEKEKRVTAEQHQYLRYELKVRNDLMNLTLGDEDSLTEDQVIQLLDGYEQSLTRPLLERVNGLTMSTEAVRGQLSRTTMQLDTVRGRINAVGVVVRRGISGILLLMAGVLLAFAHGWIGQEFVESLPMYIRYILLCGVYVADAYILLHSLFHISAWNPISRLARYLEEIVVKSIYSILGLEKL